MYDDGRNAHHTIKRVFVYISESSMCVYVIKSCTVAHVEVLQENLTSQWL